MINTQNELNMIRAEIDPAILNEKLAFYNSRLALGGMLANMLGREEGDERAPKARAEIEGQIEAIELLATGVIERLGELGAEVKSGGNGKPENVVISMRPALLRSSTHLN